MSMWQMLLISFNTQLAELLTENYDEKEPATINYALRKCFWLAGLGFFNTLHHQFLKVQLNFCGIRRASHFSRTAA